MAKTAKVIEAAYEKWRASDKKEYTIPFMIGAFGEQFKKGGKISAAEFAWALEHSIGIGK